jgi:hypothetical protein
LTATLDANEYSIVDIGNVEADALCVRDLAGTGIAGKFETATVGITLTSPLIVNGDTTGLVVSGTAGITASAVDCAGGYATVGGLKINTSAFNLFGRKQLTSGVGTVSCPAIGLNDTIIISPQVNYVAGTAVFYNTIISVGASFAITALKVSDGTVFTGDTSTVSFLVVKPLV